MVTYQQPNAVKHNQGSQDHRDEMDLHICKCSNVCKMSETKFTISIQNVFRIGVRTQ